MSVRQNRNVFEYIADYILTSIEAAINDHVIKAVNDVINGISELCGSGFKEVAQRVKDEVGDDRYVRLCSDVLQVLNELTQQVQQPKSHPPQQVGHTGEYHTPATISRENTLDNRINLIINELNTLLNIVTSLKQLLHPPAAGEANYD